MLLLPVTSRLHDFSYPAKARIFEKHISTRVAIPKCHAVPPGTNTPQIVTFPHLTRPVSLYISAAWRASQQSLKGRFIAPISFVAAHLLPFVLTTPPTHARTPNPHLSSPPRPPTPPTFGSQLPRTFRFRLPPSSLVPRTRNRSPVLPSRVGLLRAALPPVPTNISPQ